MSTFFKALEQAERERAAREREHAPRRAPGGVLVTDPPGAPAPPSPPEPAVVPAPPEPTARIDVAPAPVEPVDRLDIAPEVAGGEIDEHLVSLLRPSSFQAEQYRALRHTVETLRRTAGASLFAISSPSVGDGKTTTAINLAGALAQAQGARVLLIEGDLRQPAMAQRFGLGSAPLRGLVDAILRPGLALDDVVRRPPPYNLSVLLAGQPPAAPYEVLESPRLGALLQEARERYDYIILDTPPIVAVPDCRVIGKWVDGFLLVVAAHRTPRKLVEEALNLMEPSKVIGLVLSHDDRSVSSYGSYGTASARWTNGSAAGADR
jgi:capsular exopolysaccharide synthesis family protein